MCPWGKGRLGNILQTGPSGWVKGLLPSNRVMAGVVTGGKPGGREGNWTLKMGLTMPVFLPSGRLWPQLSHLQIGVSLCTSVDDCEEAVK